jgi:DNA-binding transcriptional LysR family regulator
LKTQRCVRIRSGDERIYRWEFERGEEKIEIDVPGCLIIDQAQVGLAAVKSGAGLLYVPEPFVRRLLDAGELRIVLKEWAPLGGGFHLYYSSRRHVPAGLRLFVELVRELRPLGF